MPDLYTETRGPTDIKMNRRIRIITTIAMKLFPLILSRLSIRVCYELRVSLQGRFYHH